MHVQEDDENPVSMPVKVYIVAILTIGLHSILLRGWWTISQNAKLLWTQLDGEAEKVIRL